MIIIKSTVVLLYNSNHQVVPRWTKMDTVISQALRLGKKKWLKRRRVFSEGFPGRWEMECDGCYMNGISNMSTGIGFCSSTVAGQVRGGDDGDAFAKPLRQNLHESLGNNALKIKKGIDKGAFDSTVANHVWSDCLTVLVDRFLVGKKYCRLFQIT